MTHEENDQETVTKAGLIELAMRRELGEITGAEYEKEAKKLQEE